METSYDVVILGGGPAGSATALAIRRKSSLSVAVIERSFYGGLRVGETIPPECQALFETLGVWKAFLQDGHTPAYGTRSYWGSGEPRYNDFLYSPYGRGWHLDRSRFDAMLARQAENQGAVLLTQTHVADCQKAGATGWHLVVQTQGRRRVNLTARRVVDATGRRAWFARRQGARKILFDRLTGAFVFFFYGSAGATDTLTLVEAWEEGWWYSAVLPGGKIVFACMTDVDILKKRRLQSPDQWRASLRAMRHSSRRLVNAQPLTSPSLHPAYSHRLDRIAGDDWLAVGDAATTFDPLSSQGILKALRSGCLAAEAICDASEGDPTAMSRYASLVAQEFESYLAMRMRYYTRERRWPASPFWRRRHDRIHLSPDRLLRFEQNTETNAAIEKLRMHLSVPDLQRLCTLCSPPRKAHEVLAAFKAEHAGSIPDQRIILALQYLVEEKVIATC